MKDRFFNGFLSGIVGGLVPLIINLSSKALGFTNLLWEQYMGVFIMGSRPNSFLELIFFIVVQFVFIGILGSLFSLIVPIISSKHLLLKGALFGISIWYVLSSLPNFLNIPELAPISLATAASNLISGTLWGIALAFVLSKIDSGLLRSTQ